MYWVRSLDPALAVAGAGPLLAGMTEPHPASARAAIVVAKALKEIRTVMIRD